MYKLKDIVEIKDVDEKVFLIGYIVNIKDKILVKDETGEILVSAYDNPYDIMLVEGCKVLVFGTTKITPSGMVIVGTIRNIDDANDELLFEFKKIIKNGE
jgi:hypothetical protein